MGIEPKYGKVLKLRDDINEIKEEKCIVRATVLRSAICICDHRIRLHDAFGGPY